jgi:hypothetical protein
MQGTVLLEQRLDAGLQEREYDFPSLSNGLYLVTLEGEGWRYPTKRWALFR